MHLEGLSQIQQTLNKDLESPRYHNILWWDFSILILILLSIALNESKHVHCMYINDQFAINWLYYVNFFNWLIILKTYDDIEGSRNKKKLHKNTTEAIDAPKTKTKKSRKNNDKILRNIKLGPEARYYKLTVSNN